MKENKSLVQEALIQMKQVEEAIAENAKGILASTMKEEINQLVKESLSEQDEEDEINLDADVDTDADNDEVEMDMDVDTDDDESDDMNMDMDIDMDSEENPIDLTGASDEEILKVFKAMGENDGIIVKKDGDDIHLTDDNSDVEYIVKLKESNYDHYRGAEKDDAEHIYDLEKDIEDDSEYTEEMGEGDMYGSFGNMKRKDYKGDTYYDENERQVRDSDLYGIGGDDFDTEEFDTFQKLYDKYGDKQSWFNKRDGESMFNKYKEMTGKPFKVKTRKGENGAIFDSIFGESKVDKVISKYFETSKKEIREGKEKQIQEEVKKKTAVKQIMESVVKMTETIEQEFAAKNFLQESPNSKFIGITNKKNLVFETKSGQVRITPKGDII